MNNPGNAQMRSPEVAKLKSYLTNMVMREMESQPLQVEDRRAAISQMLQQAYQRILLSR